MRHDFAVIADPFGSAFGAEESPNYRQLFWPRPQPVVKRQDFGNSVHELMNTRDAVRFDLASAFA